MPYLLHFHISQNTCSIISNPFTKPSNTIPAAHTHTQIHIKYYTYHKIYILSHPESYIQSNSFKQSSNITIAIQTHIQYSNYSIYLEIYIPSPKYRIYYILIHPKPHARAIPLNNQKNNLIPTQIYQILHLSRNLCIISLPKPHTRHYPISLNNNQMLRLSHKPILKYIKNYTYHKIHKPSPKYLS